MSDDLSIQSQPLHPACMAQGLPNPHASQPGGHRFHYMNAYEEGSKVHLDFAHHDTPEMLNTLYLDVMRRGDRAVADAPLRCSCLP